MWPFGPLVMPSAWKVCRGHLVFGLSVRPSVCLSVICYAPGLKGPSGASSNRIICPSVCLSVRLQFRPACKQSAIFKVWVVILYSNQTWTVSSSKGCSHGQNLGHFNLVAARGICVSQTHGPLRWHRGSGLDFGSEDPGSIPRLPSQRVDPLMARR